MTEQVTNQVAFVNPINTALKLIREAYDLDVGFLAEELQLTESEIVNIEQGLTEVSDTVIHLYAVYFEIPIASIKFFCSKRNSGLVTKPFRDKVSKMMISFLESKIKS